MLDYTYVEWLQEFIFRFGNFSYNQYFNNINNISDLDKENASKLEVLFSMVSNYANNNGINLCTDNIGYYYNILINGYTYKLGIMTNNKELYYYNKFYCALSAYNDRYDYIDLSSIIKPFYKLK